MTRWKRNRKRDAENERWPSRQRAPRPPERFPEDLARPLLSTNARRPAVHLARPRSRLQDLVDHVHQHYETDHIDIAIVTHPDQDHIGGMGRVVEGLNVDVLCVHRLRKHGGGELPAADAIDDLIKIAQDQGRSIHEPYAVSNAFGGALTVLAPDEAYYTQLVADQVGEERTGRRPPAGVPESSAPHGRRVIDSHRSYDQRFASKIRAGRIPATTRPSLASRYAIRHRVWRTRTCDVVTAHSKREERQATTSVTMLLIAPVGRRRHNYLPWTSRPKTDARVAISSAFPGVTDWGRHPAVSPALVRSLVWASARE